jgi:hypothetical protein
LRRLDPITKYLLASAALVALLLLGLALALPLLGGVAPAGRPSRRLTCADGRWTPSARTSRRWA